MEIIERKDYHGWNRRTVLRIRNRRTEDDVTQEVRSLDGQPSHNGQPNGLLNARGPILRRIINRVIGVTDWLRQAEPQIVNAIQAMSTRHPKVMSTEKHTVVVQREFPGTSGRCRNLHLQQKPHQELLLGQRVEKQQQ